AMRVGGCSPFHRLFTSPGCRTGWTGTDTAGADRCRIHTASVLRQPQDDGVPAWAGALHQPQAGTAAHVQAGTGGHGAGSEYQPAPPQHKTYPYLLRGVEVTQPNLVWSSDITYIRLARGFVYLVAVIDWYSRKVLAWRVSNTLDSG